MMIARGNRQAGNHQLYQQDVAQGDQRADRNINPPADNHDRLADAYRNHRCIGIQKNW